MCIRDRDYYAHLIEKLPCRVAVDADGETLARAVEKAPFLIKPNRDELSMLTGLPLETEAELLAAGRDLLTRGVSVCAISPVSYTHLAKLQNRMCLGFPSLFHDMLLFAFPDHQKA